MKKTSLLNAFGQISALTALSRLFGFIRDVVFAYYLGAGPAADAFLVAFKLPNLFRRLTAEGALTNAFLPVYSLVKTRQGTGRALILAAEVQTALLLALCVIVIVMELFMPVIIAFLAPGFATDSDRLTAAINLARVTIPYLPMISLVALWAAILNNIDDYFAGAAAPIILNIMLICGAVMVPFARENFSLAPAMIALPVALAVLLAGVAQMILLQSGLRRAKIKLKWPGLTLSKQARSMWISFVPAALGAGATQINLLVDLILASFLEVGAISWLYYADRIAQLPLGLVGIALGTALLPRLSRIEAGGEDDTKTARFADQLAAGFIPAAMLTLPATAAFLVIAHPLISGLFQFGAFQASDAQASAAALLAYSIGLPAFVGLKLTLPALYAMNKGRLVLIISLITVILNIILSLIFMRYLGHVGLALATALVSWIALIWQVGWLFSHQRLNSAPIKPIILSGLCAGVMALCLYVIQPIFDEFFDDRVAVMGALVGIGLLIYLILAGLSGLFNRNIFKK